MLKQFIWNVLIVSIVFFAFWALFEKERIHTISGQAPVQVINNNYKVSEPGPKFEVWLTRLGKGEACPPHGLVDTNNKKSYGTFCYQEYTFLMFVRKYNLLPQAEDREVLNFIGDKEFQLLLTKKVFDDDLDNWIHWQTTIRRIGLPPKYET